MLLVLTLKNTLNPKRVHRVGHGPFMCPLEKRPACTLGGRHLNSAHTPAAGLWGDSGVHRALTRLLLRR